MWPARGPPLASSSQLVTSRTLRGLSSGFPPTTAPSFAPTPRPSSHRTLLSRFKTPLLLSSLVSQVHARRRLRAIRPNDDAVGPWRPTFCRPQRSHYIIGGPCGPDHGGNPATMFGLRSARIVPKTLLTQRNSGTRDAARRAGAQEKAKPGDRSWADGQGWEGVAVAVDVQSFGRAESATKFASG